MNMLVKGLIRVVGTFGLKKIKGKVDGKKCHAIGILGVLVALAGVYWGPIDILPGPAELIVPALTYKEFWGIVWGSTSLMAGRSAIKKIQK